VPDEALSELTVAPVAWPADHDAVVEFLTAHEWPFHAASRLTRQAAAAVEIATDDVASFWIRAGDTNIGLIRLLDLGDLEDGSPLFDLRIGTRDRGRGVGRRAVEWLTEHLFAISPSLHRIEATTRSDNLAMQAVFRHSGYRQEARMVEAWKNADGSRSDTLGYAILRREFAQRRVADPLRERQLP
jgi:RimJ/RimL family protein N-acetyltransferase